MLLHYLFLLLGLLFQQSNSARLFLELSFEPKGICPAQSRLRALRSLSRAWSTGEADGLTSRDAPIED